MYNVAQVSTFIMAKLTLKPVSVISALATSLRERVLNGELAPEIPLPELELRSSTVWRAPYSGRHSPPDAHRSSQSRANRSAFVPRMSEEEIYDLFSVRKVVETEGRSPGDPVRLRPAAAEQAVRLLESFPTDTQMERRRRSGSAVSPRARRGDQESTAAAALRAARRRNTARDRATEAGIRFARDARARASGAADRHRKRKDRNRHRPHPPASRSGDRRPDSRTLPADVPGCVS